MFIASERVELRPFEEGDIDDFCVWLNDREVTHFMFYGQTPWTKEQVSEFVLGQINNPNNVIFIALDRESGNSIGFCGIYDWHRTGRRAEMRILIGAKEIWGKGIGTEIVELLTWYGFDRLNLHRMYLGFTAANSAAGRAYEKAGYEHEGVLRDDIYRNGQYYDSVRMGLLRPQYYDKYVDEHRKRFALEKPGYVKEK